MQTTRFFAILLGLVPALPAAAATFGLEAGGSYIYFRDSDPERDIAANWVDEPEKAAPFIAASIPLNNRVGLRLAYHYASDIDSTAEFASPPGTPLGVVVWGHYRDDLHIVTVGPEFFWSIAPRLALTLSPELNWVASRGHVRYSTDDPVLLDLLVPPHRHNDDGFTLGIAGRLGWAMTERSSIFASYRHADLEPSFGRQAHILSAGFSLRF